LIRILKVNRQTGKAPTWRELCDDPAIREETRQKLKTSKIDKISSKEEVLSSIKILNGYRQLRGMFQLAEDTVVSLRKKKANPSKLLDAMASTIVGLRQNRSEGNQVLNFGKGNNSSKIVKGLLNEEEKNYLPTGFKAFDDENGGVSFGNLFLLAGSTGGGKSTLAAQLGINWADMGEDVTIVPLEMSEEEMTARLMANAAGLDVRKILFRRLSRDEKKIYWKSYKRFVIKKKKAEGSFRVFKPKSDMTIEEIFATVYPLGSRVVIIDYVSLLKGVDGDDAWQKLGAVARYCKIYAETNNIIVVLLAQVSDEGIVRYARSLVEHANYAWRFVATSITREHEIINIDQLKARNGRMFDFTLRAQMDLMRIRDLELEEKEELMTKMNGGSNSESKSKSGSKGSRKDKTDHHKRKGRSGPDSGSSEKNKKSIPSKDYLKDLSDDDED
jgi:replicative DNA helicase